MVEELDVWLELIEPFDFEGWSATVCAPRSFGLGSLICNFNVTMYGSSLSPVGMMSCHCLVSKRPLYPNPLDNANIGLTGPVKTSIFSHVVIRRLARRGGLKGGDCRRSLTLYVTCFEVLVLVQYQSLICFST